MGRGYECGSCGMLCGLIKEACHSTVILVEYSLIWYRTAAKCRSKATEITLLQIIILLINGHSIKSCNNMYEHVIILLSLEAVTANTIHQASPFKMKV